MIQFSHELNNIFMRQSIDIYLVGQSQIQSCKEDILKQMAIIKQKIDTIEKGQQEHRAEQISVFVIKFKKDLKFILHKFQKFQKVLDRLGKEVYQKHELSKQILINTIRQQMKRFHNLIPSHIQQQITSSKVRSGSAPSSFLSQIVEPAQQIPKTQKGRSVSQGKEQQTNQQSQQQFQQLISTLSEFIAKNEQSQQKQYDSLEQWSTNDAAVSNQMKQMKRGQLATSIEEMQERERYKEFIKRQKIRQSRTPAKIAGKVLICLLITLLIFIVLASVVVYKVVKAIAGEL